MQVSRWYFLIKYTYTEFQKASEFSAAWTHRPQRQDVAKACQCKQWSSILQGRVQNSATVRSVSSLAVNSVRLDGWSHHLRRARYRAREYFISLSCSIQNIKSLRQILVILGRNGLVAVRLEVPEVEGLSLKLSFPDSSGLFFLGPIAARAVRLASLYWIWASSNCCNSLAFCFNLSCSGSSLLERLLAAFSNISVLDLGKLQLLQLFGFLF